MIPLEHLTYQEIGVTEPGEVVFMRPFGPAVGHATLPPEIVEEFNRDIDNGTKGIDWSDRLVGQVHAENLIPTEVIQEHVRFFTDAALLYVDQYASRHCHPVNEDIKPVVTIHSAWYVRQRAGDFNPIHLHTNAELSAIGYLQMPDDIEAEWNADDQDHYPAHGHVEFLHGSPTFLNKASFMVRPKAGDFFIFPADMLHTVYPFRCDGERRSFSMNIILSEKEDDDGDEE